MKSCPCWKEEEEKEKEKKARDDMILMTKSLMFRSSDCEILRVLIKL